MIKISAIVGEKLKAVGTSFNKTVAGVSVSKVLASAAILRAGLSYTTGKFFNFLQRLFEDQGVVGDTKYLNVQKGLLDTTTFIDQKNVSFVKSSVDIGQTVDQFSRTVTYSRTYEDQSGVFDNFNRVIGFSRTFQDQAQSVEILKLSTVKSVSDNSSVLDLYSSAVSYNRGFNDVATATDDVNGAALDDDQNILFFKVVSESGTASEVFNRTLEFFRTYTDSSSTVDVHSVGYTKNHTDSGSATDSYSRTVEFSRAPEDTSTVSETNTFDVSKTLSDGSGSTDQLFYAYSKSSSDTGTVLDLYSSAVSYNRGFSDVATATDDVNGAALDDDQNILFFKVVSESGTASEVFNRTLEYFRTYTDSSSTVDLHSVGYTKNTSDGSTSIDSLSLETSKNLNDFGQVQETASITNIFIRNFLDASESFENINLSVVKQSSDTAGASDQYYITAEYYRNVSDLSVSSDELSLSNTYVRGYQDSSLNQDLATLQYVKNISDTVIGTENLNKQSGSALVLTESISSTDDINGAALDDDQNILFFKVISEQQSTTDNYNRTVDFSRIFSDNTNSFEILALDTSKPLSDQGSVTDLQTTGYGKQPQDASTIQDVLARSVDYSRTYSDTIDGIIDNYTASTSKQLSNAGSITDNYNRTVDFSRIFSDNTNSFEILALDTSKPLSDQGSVTDLQTTGYGKQPQDASTIQDVLARSVDYYRTYQDLVSSTDDVNGAALDDDQNILFFKVIGDSGSLSDNASLSPNKQPAETSTVSDQGVLLNQSFIDPTYLAEDYVGDSRILT